MSAATAPEPEGTKLLLEVRNLEAGYGPVKVLHGIDLQVPDGGIVVVLGANGAGKTTTLRALCGMIPARGTIVFDGTDIAGIKAERASRLGIAHVPQGRGTFMEMTVDENLQLGAYTRSNKAELAEDLERWFTLFPRLKERRTQVAGSLSGGEQQMLAIARALMSRPRLLLLDEPSLGLAPIITQALFRTLRQINEEYSTTMLIVEQNANLALDIAGYAYVLETGTVALSGEAGAVKLDDNVRRAYLGY